MLDGPTEASTDELDSLRSSALFFSTKDESFPTWVQEENETTTGLQGQSLNKHGVIVSNHLEMIEHGALIVPQNVADTSRARSTRCNLDRRMGRRGRPVNEPRLSRFFRVQDSGESCSTLGCKKL